MMKALYNAIVERGNVIGDQIVKVDSFVNHQIDCALMDEIGQSISDRYNNANITKIVTIETSGIAPSYAAALRMGVPLVFIKKTLPSTMQNPVHAKVFSFTKNKEYDVCLEKEFIKKDDNILFIDDFLANGEAFKAAEQLIEQCGANIHGVSILIEKRFQKGHQYIVDKGYDFYPLVSIDHIEDGKIIFADDGE